jgi:hypothetical protein
LSLFERKPRISNGNPTKEGISEVKLPVVLDRYEKIPQIIRIEPEIIARFGIVWPRNLNSLLMFLRKRLGLIF